MSFKFAVVRVFKNTSGEKKGIIVQFDKEELKQKFKEKLSTELQGVLDQIGGIVDQIEFDFRSQIMLKVYKDNKYNMAVEYDKDVLKQKFKEKLFVQLQNKEGFFKRKHKKADVVGEIDSIFEQIEGELKNETVRIP